MSVYLHLDILAHQNHLRHLPPQQKLGFGLEVFGLAWLSHWPVQLLLLAWVSVWLLVYAKIPGSAYRQLFAMATGFLLVGVVVLMVNIVPVTAIAVVGTDEVVGVSWGGWHSYLSAQGTVTAFTVFCRSLAAIAGFLFIVCTIPITELLRLFQAWGLPTVLLDLMLLMYRFIFMILRTFNELYQAQQSRLGYQTWGSQWRSVQLLTGQLLIRSLQHYQAFQLGLAARGFRGQLQVYSERDYHFCQRYAWEAVIGGLVLVGLELSYRRYGGPGWGY